MQPPGDSHRQLRFMLHIGRRSEKVESAFVPAPSAKQHDAHALVSMMLVSLSTAMGRLPSPLRIR